MGERDFHRNHCKIGSSKAEANLSSLADNTLSIKNSRIDSSLNPVRIAHRP